eukprot:TRINITY_DN22337_c0_g1_i1.p1 TRINITY_DN22337_c0_g1~~TRINITY_DN22337_c0_g1_i1.p1  ORF type:complete len:129 (+),score=39.42 TRINITY_DN22337_c0_g1_i1:75-461(+)
MQKLTFLTFAALYVASVAATESNDVSALDDDDECLISDAPEACALNALQARTKALARLDQMSAELMDALAQAVMKEACGQGGSMSQKNKDACKKCGGELHYDSAAADGLGYAFCFCRVGGHLRQCAAR